MFFEPAVSKPKLIFLMSYKQILFAALVLDAMFRDQKVEAPQGDLKDLVASSGPLPDPEAVKAEFMMRLSRPPKEPQCIGPSKKGKRRRFPLPKSSQKFRQR